MKSMQPFANKSVGIILTHTLLWGLFGFVLMFYHPLSWGVKLPAAFWIKQGLHTFLLLLLFYANYLYFVPKILFGQRPSLYFIWILAAVILTLSVSFTIETVLPEQWQTEDTRLPPPRPKSFINGFVLMTTLLVLGISTSIAAVQRYQQKARTAEELQRQQITAELSFLKAQINPHFFFNTLNSIYSLSYTDVQAAREALHTLSRMMRYLLYDTGHNEASLSKEINFIKDHIDLMKLRLLENMVIRFEEPQLDRDYSIAPMLLFPFVENAFKHGITTKHDATITIRLAVNGNVLRLRVENPVFRKAETTDDTLEGGIGLSNTKRRLELLYPGKYSLEVNDDQDKNFYSVNLTLMLS